MVTEKSGRPADTANMFAIGAASLGSPSFERAFRAVVTRRLLRRPTKSGIGNKIWPVTRLVTRLRSARKPLGVNGSRGIF